MPEALGDHSGVAPISQVLVEGLFGVHDYLLRPADSPRLSGRRLLLLYGDNGSGKTTLLRLLVATLSPRYGRGGLTFVSRTPFRAFSLLLGDDREVRFDRPAGELTGDFRAVVRLGDQETVFEVATSDKRPVRDMPEARGLIRHLEALDLRVHYLRDDRRTEGLPPTEDEEESAADRYYVTASRRIQAGPRHLDSEALVEKAVRRVEEWFQKQALKGSSQGEANASSVYSDVVRRISEAPDPRKRGALRPVDVDALVARLMQIESRSAKFAAYGLLSPHQNASIVQILGSTTETKKQIIQDVISPYLESAAARLEALDALYVLLDLFVTTLNGFLNRKRVVFDLAHGIEVVTKDGTPLRPAQLSSGERQLLLLFCNTVLAREAASIFLIDEPEISLNVKWQRQLLGALLGLTQGTGVQFFLATHSIELLSQYRECVIQLGGAHT